jgi:hypothetical protein
MEFSWSRDSAVGIATGYGLDGQGGQSSSPDRGKIFLLSTSFRQLLKLTQPPIQWVPEVKQPRREADNSLPTSVYVTNKWIYVYISTPP